MEQITPELQSLYSELINHMKQGVEMHEQLADYYAFLNLPGYQKCHEYQMLCELLTYRKAKDMYLKEYNKLVQPTFMDNGGMTNMANGSNPMRTIKNYASNVIPVNWYSHTRYDVDASTKRNAVKEGFKKWIDYEKDTKEFLTQMVQKIEQMGEHEAARKLYYLVDHVDKEIDTAEEKMMNLESAGYDMNYILQEQEPMKRKYAKKIKEMNDKNLQYRYRGYGNYANYNWTDDDDEDDYEMYKAPMPDHRRYGRYY